jgi:hypothetical protein
MWASLRPTPDAITFASSEQTKRQLDSPLGAFGTGHGRAA